MDTTLFLPLAVGLGLGLLVGLQREWSTDEVAGIRTFPLITVLGVLSAHMGESYGGWIVAVGLLVVAGLLVQGNVIRMAEDDDPGAGLTTEVAALVMFGVGVVLYLGRIAEAVVLGGVVAVLLHAKKPLHRMVDALSDQDLSAIVQFVVVALVVLPLLPDRAYGPYGVLNPFHIWLMVALIVGISIAAWAAYRLLGRRVGTVLTGILGGLISSTATTVSYARRSRGREGDASGTVFVILMASAVVFARVVFEIGVVARASFAVLAPPLVVMLLVVLVVAGVHWLRSAGEERESAGLPEEAPSELRTAIVFGLLYALVLLAVAAARQHLGDPGLYAVAALSGLTDMDAITLSTAQLVTTGHVAADTAWRAILVAGLSNMVFKGGVVAALGSRRIRRPIFAGFGVAGVAGVLLIWLWP